MLFIGGCQGREFVTRTDAEGVYFFVQVLPGEYALVVHALDGKYTWKVEAFNSNRGKIAESWGYQTFYIMTLQESCYKSSNRSTARGCRARD